MISRRETTLSGLVLLAVAGLAAAALLCPPEYLLAVLLAAGGIAVFAMWSAMGSLLVAICGWFVTVIAFDEEFWRAKVPFFFNVTIPRLLILVLLGLWAAMWLLGRTRLRRSGWIMPLMLALLALFTASAAASGFKTIAVASVHYRLIGGFWFAFIIFFLVQHALRSESDFTRLLVFFLFVGLYLTFTGWLEHFKVWSLVFPDYIADPEKGIHWGRARGPFLVSPTLGLTLLFCFFSNLTLARSLRGPLKPLIYVACLLILPVLFWTQTRSVWLGFVIAGAVWLLGTRRHLSKAAAVCTVAALFTVALAVNWPNVLSTQRERGGVTDAEPVYMRLGLTLITWDIFKDHPFFGVGFGHFRDVAPGYAKRLDSHYYEFASSAMEHNNFLSILAETGLAGLSLYVALLAVLLAVSLRLHRRLPAAAPGPINRDLVVLYWVLFAAYLIDGMFRETSVHPFTNCLFFGFSGVMAALDWLLRPQPLRLPQKLTGGRGLSVAATPAAEPAP